MPATIEVFTDLELCPNCGEFKKSLTEVEGWCLSCTLPPDMVEVICYDCERPFGTKLNEAGNAPRMARCGACKYQLAKKRGWKAALPKGQRKKATR